MNTRNTGKNLVALSTAGIVGGAVALATVFGMQFAESENEGAGTSQQVAVVEPAATAQGTQSSQNTQSSQGTQGTQSSQGTQGTQGITRSQGAISNATPGYTGSSGAQPRTRTSGS